MSEAEILQLLVISIGCVSLPAIAFIVYWRTAKGRLLAYEPRWPVPWGLVGAVFVGALLGLNLLALTIDRPPIDQPSLQAGAQSERQLLQMALLGCVQNLVIVLLIAGTLVRSVGAAWNDLGLPSNLRQTARDVSTGVLAGLAVLLPVYAIQMLLVFVLRIPSSHPTLERLLESPSLVVILVALLSAGLTAPIFEEFFFRLLFQGWLERTEDELLGAMGKMRFEDDSGEQDAEEPETNEETALEEALPDPSVSFASPFAERVKMIRKRGGKPPTPPDESAPGLPHGWAPVLISSFVFMLAHVSQGAACISLFPLALLLGYLYQRTHRILPSVVAHMTFNVCSLALAWLQTHFA